MQQHIVTLPGLGNIITEALVIKTTQDNGSSDKYRGQPISVEQHSTMAQYSSNSGAVLE